MDREQILSVINKYKFEPWQIFSVIFLSFYILSCLFDHFVISLVLCVGGGLIADNFNDFMKNGEIKGENEKKNTKSVPNLETKGLSGCFLPFPLFLTFISFY